MNFELNGMDPADVALVLTPDERIAWSSDCAAQTLTGSSAKEQLC
jgi:hypothetical protein